MPKYLDGTGLQALCERLNTSFIKTNAFSRVITINTVAGENTVTIPSDFLTSDEYDSMVVFLDGLRLVKNSDYTFNSSTRVLTFVDTFITGDIVTVGIYTNGYDEVASAAFPALSTGILTSDGTNMSWKNFTKMVYTQDTTSANDLVIIPQANLSNAVVTEVFRNGLLMVETDDYSINSSTREITFVVPLAANEKIVVITQNAIVNNSSILSGLVIQDSTANTPSSGDNSTKIATTAFVNNAIANNAITSSFVSPTLTGTPTAPTAATGTNTTQIATTEFVNNTVSNYVDLDSTQTISGSKTFTNALTVKTTGSSAGRGVIISNPDIVKGTAPSGSKYANIVFYGDAVSSISDRIGLVECQYNSDKSIKVGLHAYNSTSADNTNMCSISCHVDSSGNAYTYAPTPDTSDNSTKIATTAYVKSNLANYVDLSTNQSLNGNKTMSGTLSAKYVDIGYSGDIETSLVQLNIGHPSRFSNLGDLPSSASYSGIYFTDHSGKTYGSNVIGMIEHSVSTSGTSSLSMRALKNVSSGNTTAANICELKVSIDSAGNKVTAAPTPATSDNSTQIATTEYVNNKFANPIEKVNAITSASSITIDPNTGSLFTLTLGVNSSITIGNLSGGPYATNGATITLYLTNTNKTISWNSKITWVSGEAPDVTSNPSIITFVTFNGGTKWYGSSIEVES